MSKRFTEEQNQQWLDSLPKKNVAVKVIVRSDHGRVLLLKPDYKDKWQLPGGVVEANEDPRVAAARETKEEANLTLGLADLSIAGVVFKPEDDTLFLIYVYSKAINEAADYSVDDKEIEAFAFFRPEEVLANLPEYYNQALRDYFSAAK